MLYNHQKIEAKWQARWDKQNLFNNAKDAGNKYYILDMFPYPSGVGLHVGHPRGYIATDIIARYHLLQGERVLHPMGWDAFGLPAENYALKQKVHPRKSTAANVENYRRQLKMLGLAYDWSREVNTTDPDYYKWTQWAFGEMFKRGLVYESREPINWCPTCLTGLANEDLEDGKCERCGSLVEKKPLRQWVIKITDYAERLLADLHELSDWPESIKDMQKNWIGRSRGAVVRFSVTTGSETTRPSGNNEIEVFTTRPDTIFGATYLVIAPEKISAGRWPIANWSEIEDYLDKIKNKSELERTDLNKDKSGVKLEGVAAVNPATGEEVPIFAADYVLSHYGTGAIMAVPAHDERDWEFAKKHGLPIKFVVQSSATEECWTGEGESINSDFLNGLSTAAAQKKIIAWLEEKKIGEGRVTYKLKDWVFSRQRYWGEPIPLIHCASCQTRVEAYKSEHNIDTKLPIANCQFPNGENKFSLGELLNPGWMLDENLPVTLPEVESYEPSGTGESPLANIKDWVEIKCPRCGGAARRETNTMPQWAGSSWYYLRYCDPRNDRVLADPQALEEWLPVDCYVGGAEQATRHLIYARFWHKFLFDLDLVKDKEPFKKYRSVGLILAEDNRKMSKRWHNVVSPDDVVVSHGVDALRVYEMFMGPFGEAIGWKTNGLLGARKFLDRVYKLSSKISEKSTISDIETGRLLHQTIKKVGDDINNFKFNTAVSALMILVNHLNQLPTVSRADFEALVVILSPFAPHLAEELWAVLHTTGSVFAQPWPKFDPTVAQDEMVSLVVQINGKTRDVVSLARLADQETAQAAALASIKVQRFLNGRQPEKMIYVPGRLVNILIKQ